MERAKSLSLIQTLQVTILALTSRSECIFFATKKLSQKTEFTYPLEELAVGC
ncbi:hypothetical protein JZO77_13190 [Enterococcus hulanensis]|uniref:hypothetical protein n=1 Tax=Enterococcus hulanensis TaxID=2559929 RepID=UPI001A8DE8FC|nr:hypothetical protein [Enterococcus hulanensis]MBO0457688.1 hypothetical protein [Enterococcus hulanensis]